MTVDEVIEILKMISTEGGGEADVMGQDPWQDSKYSVSDIDHDEDDKEVTFSY